MPSSESDSSSDSSSRDSAFYDAFARSSAPQYMGRSSGVDDPRDMPGPSGIAPQRPQQNLVVPGRIARDRLRRRLTSQSEDLYLRPEDSQLSDWFTQDMPQKRYFPQIGDEIVYFRQGHEIYLSFVKKKYQRFYYPKVTAPWCKFILSAQEHCRVIDVEFVMIPSRMCKIQLRLLRDHLPGDGIFTIYYHPIPEAMDFLVLRDEFDRSKLCRYSSWRVADRFRCAMPNNTWRKGVITAIEPLDQRYPQSRFQRYRVRWDDDTVGRLSGWDLEFENHESRIAPRNASIEICREEIDALQRVLRRGCGEWPLGSRERFLKAIAPELELLLNQLFCEPLIDACHERNNPIYLSVIAYPMDLGLILLRLDSGFYRRMSSLRFDLSYFRRNAADFYPPTHDYAQIAKLCSKLLLRIIRDGSINVTLRIKYRRLFGGAHYTDSDSEEEERKTPKRLKTSTNNENQPPVVIVISDNEVTGNAERADQRSSLDRQQPSVESPPNEMGNAEVTELSDDGLPEDLSRADQRLPLGQSVTINAEVNVRQKMKVSTALVNLSRTQNGGKENIRPVAVIRPFVINTEQQSTERSQQRNISNRTRPPATRSREENNSNSSRPQAPRSQEQNNSNVSRRQAPHSQVQNNGNSSQSQAPRSQVQNNSSASRPQAPRSQVQNNSSSSRPQVPHSREKNDSNSNRLQEPRPREGNSRNDSPRAITGSIENVRNLLSTSRQPSGIEINEVKKRRPHVCNYRCAVPEDPEFDRRHQSIEHFQQQNNSNRTRPPAPRSQEENNSNSSRPQAPRSQEQNNSNVSRPQTPHSQVQNNSSSSRPQAPRSREQNDSNSNRPQAPRPREGNSTGSIENVRNQPSTSCQPSVIEINGVKKRRPHVCNIRCAVPEDPEFDRSAAQQRAFRKKLARNRSFFRELNIGPNERQHPERTPASSHVNNIICNESSIGQSQGRASPLKLVEIDENQTNQSTSQRRERNGTPAPRLQNQALALPTPSRASRPPGDSVDVPTISLVRQHECALSLCNLRESTPPTSQLAENVDQPSPTRSKEQNRFVPLVPGTNQPSTSQSREDRDGTAYTLSREVDGSQPSTRRSSNDNENLERDRATAGCSQQSTDRTSRVRRFCSKRPKQSSSSSSTTSSTSSDPDSPVVSTYKGTPKRARKNKFAKMREWRADCMRVLETLWKDPDAAMFREAAMYRFRRSVIVWITLEYIMNCLKHGLIMNPHHLVDEVNSMLLNGRCMVYAGRINMLRINRIIDKLSLLFDGLIDPVIRKWKISKAKRKESEDKNVVSEEEFGEVTDSDLTIDEETSPSSSLPDSTPSPPQA